MEWPLHDRPVARGEVPVFNAYYRDACGIPSDPSMVWGTEVRMTAIEQSLAARNATGDILVTTSHALLKATGLVLRERPQFNRRLIGRQIYRFRSINVLTSLQNVREHRADVYLLRDAAEKPVSAIAAELRDAAKSALDGRYKFNSHATFYSRLPLWLSRPLLRFNLHLMNHWNLPATDYNERQRCSPVLVNYLGGPGTALMRTYKPSRLPIESYPLNVTMGRTELRPVVESGNVIAARVAPLYVRADHRLVDALELGRFVQLLATLLQQPDRLFADGDARAAATPELTAEASAPLMSLPRR